MKKTSFLLALSLVALCAPAPVVATKRPPEGAGIK